MNLKPLSISLRHHLLSLEMHIVNLLKKLKNQKENFHFFMMMQNYRETSYFFLRKKCHPNFNKK